MMGTVLVLLLAIVSVEYFLHLPFVKEGKKLLIVAQKAVRIMSPKHISDIGNRERVKLPRGQFHNSRGYPLEGEVT